MACVVLAFENPRALVRAVRSIVAQSEPVELVVVNSGGGGARRSLAEAGLDVRVIERPDRLFPGGARNLGIASTSAPWVSFLADDCEAEPGWVEARLAAHRAGAEAVASAVTNPDGRNVAAWTSYVSLFNRRMPGISPARALLYGASYARDLFSRFGNFREDLRTGEDTEFHQRLAGRVPIVWEPRVRTAHRHPTDFRSLLSDHFRRGARSAATWREFGGPGALAVAANAIRRAPAAARSAWEAAEPKQRKWIAAAALLLPVPVLAYAAGSLSGGWASGRPGPPSPLVREAGDEPGPATARNREA
jgi:GT2 family glycosyltransferase